MRFCLGTDFRESFEKADQDGRLSVQFGLKRYRCLVSEKLDVAIDLQITILVPNKDAAAVREGGDLDNRLKTLFDALRAPAQPNEIPDTDEFDYAGEGMFCLMRDDNLIKNISVQMHQDYAPIDKDTVLCLMLVNTRLLAMRYDNLAYV
ncbi:MAG: hypothetical protein J0H09_05140 [Burkholderiales bacterium]|nr:hypothetical protein [Burkholderiales bacterium]